MHARASVERRSRETRETRAAAWEEKRASPVSRHQSRAWSFACLGRFARRTKKKERLLVVYAWVSKNLKVMGSPHSFEKILKFSAFSLSLEWTLRDDRCTHEKRHTNYINNRGGSRNFLLGEGGPNFGSERTAELFCGKLLLLHTPSHQSRLRVIIPCPCARKGCIIVDRLKKQRRPRVSQSVNAGPRWRV